MSAIGVQAPISSPPSRSAMPASPRGRGRPASGPSSGRRAAGRRDRCRRRSPAPGGWRRAAPPPRRGSPGAATDRQAGPCAPPAGNLPPRPRLCNGRHKRLSSRHHGGTGPCGLDQRGADSRQGPRAGRARLGRLRGGGRGRADRGAQGRVHLPCRSLARPDDPRRVDFLALSTYGDATATTGAVRLIMDLRTDIRGRHVLVVEDIVDTGYTLSYLLRMLHAREPASLKCCALLRKLDRKRVDVTVDYLGFDIPTSGWSATASTGPTASARSRTSASSTPPPAEAAATAPSRPARRGPAPARRHARSAAPRRRRRPARRGRGWRADPGRGAGSPA